MNRSGGADRPGPAPRACAGNPKARSGAASPKGFTVRCFWVAARDWRRIGSSANEGRFRQVRPANPRKGPTRQPRLFRQNLLPPANARGSGHCLPRPPLHADKRLERSHEAAPSPSPSSAICYGKSAGQMRNLAPADGQGSPLSIGTLSARASRGLARPDSRRRPRRSPRPWRASAHRGRCQAARS